MLKQNTSNHMIHNQWWSLLVLFSSWRCISYAAWLNISYETTSAVNQAKQIHETLNASNGRPSALVKYKHEPSDDAGKATLTECVLQSLAKQNQLFLIECQTN